MSKMPDREFDRLVDAWIRATNAPEGSSEREELWWAIDALFLLPVQDRETTWRFVLEVLRRRPRELVLGMLAAGPIEALLVHHGEMFIERVEMAAVHDATFRRILGIVQAAFEWDICRGGERA